MASYIGSSDGDEKEMLALTLCKFNGKESYHGQLTWYFLFTLGTRQKFKVAKVEHDHNYHRKDNGGDLDTKKMNFFEIANVEHDHNYYRKDNDDDMEIKRKNPTVIFIPFSQICCPKIWSKCPEFNENNVSVNWQIIVSAVSELWPTQSSAFNYWN